MNTDLVDHSIMGTIGFFLNFVTSAAKIHLELVVVYIYFKSFMQSSLFFTKQEVQLSNFKHFYIGTFNVTEL